MADMDIDRIVEHIVAKVMSGLPSSESATSPDTFVHEVDVNRKDTVKRVALGADHRGYEAKCIIDTYLKTLGFTVVDEGVFGTAPVDYPEIAVAVACRVASGDCDRGIMIDGSGIGSAMVCNKVRGVRGALCYDMRTIINSREHSNANVLALGGPFHSGGELCEMAKVWLETRFVGGRHWARVNKIMATERE